MVQLPSRSVTGSELCASDASETVSVQDSLDWDILSEEWLSDEPELESDLHRDQIDLLLRLMRWHWRGRNDIYYSGNTTVYYDAEQRTTRNFRGPDLYVVLGAEPRPRSSWMTWREGGKYPNVVLELLSDSTAKVDRITKKALYQDVWRLPEYFWFHPRTLEFKGFRLRSGQYEEIQRNERGHLWSRELDLYLGLFEEKLRLFSAEGALIELEEEEERRLKEEERRQKEEERRLKEEAEERAERLAQRLRDLGVEPDELI